MNALATLVANYVRERVSGSTGGGDAEVRLLFRGPPVEILAQVFEQLASGGHLDIPVLMQAASLPEGHKNPAVGESGLCSGEHLLDLRNSTARASYVALVPPGQHSNMSVSTTTDEFGMLAANNAGNMQFEDWLSDEFVQALVDASLRQANLGDKQAGEARRLVEACLAAADEADPERTSRGKAWEAMSRLFEATASDADGMATRIALACGVPPTSGGNLAQRDQLSVLAKLADVLSEGFVSGLESAIEDAGTADRDALNAFLSHVKASCELPMLFDRSPSAYYAPFQGPALWDPPAWWTVLTVEKWQELLTEESASKGDLGFEVRGLLWPPRQGIPAIVSGPVHMAFTSRDEMHAGVEVAVTRTPAGSGKAVGTAVTDSGVELVDGAPPPHWNPLRYVAVAEGFKPASSKVISLAAWGPGIVLAARHARKSSPPRRRKGRSGPDFEASLAFEGSGKYEVHLFTSPEVSIDDATIGVEGAAERGEAQRTLLCREVEDSHYLVELDVDAGQVLDLELVRAEPGKPVARQRCRVSIVMEEVDEGGCRSEFERLVRANRRTLDPAEGRLQVRLDRNPRIAGLEEWMLSDELVGESYRPIVIAADLEEAWRKPGWNEPAGPLLSEGRFIKDPRPSPGEFSPPAGFLEARAALAARIRGEDHAGLVESASLGLWLSTDDDFRASIEQYLQAYSRWLEADPDIACWIDTVLVTSMEGNRALSRTPDAILLSPLHPVRLAWQALAQQMLRRSEEGRPCPSASVLDPDCVPDMLQVALRGAGGIEHVQFVSVENGTDYWSVLWNSQKLKELPARSRQAPFGRDLGITVGGIAVGFSAAQVERALDGVYDLLAAKPVTSVAITSSGGTTDACNQGVMDWCRKRYLPEKAKPSRQSSGPRLLEVYDRRDAAARPDHASISNLGEDTANQVRWFDRQPGGAIPDLGIIAQLDMSDPSLAEVPARTALGHGGLVRHRVRRQLPDAFISESRRSSPPVASGDALADKLASCISAMENLGSGGAGLNFAPNVHAVRDMLDAHKADFVAVSSSAIDPACFLGDWLEQAYLWDYELPSYSRRAGDTNGYYLLSRVKEADREALATALARLPGCESMAHDDVQAILKEIARRGIPTVKGLAGDDAGTTGDLGLFLAVRLLQDRFRTTGPLDSLLPVMSGGGDDMQLALIVPVDPFLEHLKDLGIALDLEAPASRPDLLVAGVQFSGSSVRLHLTPVEVKCRPETNFPSGDVAGALGQARNMSTLLSKLLQSEDLPGTWTLAGQHLLLSMLGFGLRVYSQHEDVVDPARWTALHQMLATAILAGECQTSVDPRGRLVIIDASGMSKPIDSDGDGFFETVIVCRSDAATMVKGDTSEFYGMVRASLDDWGFMPPRDPVPASAAAQPQPEMVASKPAADAAQPGEPPAGEDAPVVPVEIPPEPIVDAGDPAPAASPSHVGKGIVLNVGKTVDGFAPRELELNISDTRLNHLNMGVVGDLGTGKTQLLKSLIMQVSQSADANRGIRPRFLIFDYKRDYASPEFVEATGARIVRPERIPLNLFDTSSMEDAAAPWLQRYRFFSDVLDKIYSGIGPVQRDKLKKAVKASYAATPVGKPPTLYDIHAAYADMVEGKADSILAIIEDLVDMEVFASRVEDTVPFDEFLDGVVVIALDLLGQDDRSKNMLVAVMLNLFYENMLRTPKRPFLGTDPQLRAVDSYLLVDEADNIMRYEFDVLRKLLLQGREFGTGVILASQYLRHFKVNATDYRDPLLTWFVHKVPNVTPAELSALGLPGSLGDTAERIKTLKNHQCLYKSFDVGGEIIRGLPFFELVTGKK